LLVQAFSASIELLNRGEASQQQKAAFEQELLDALDDEIIRPLCADIEADLRRHVDSARSNGAANLETKDIGTFLRVVPLRVAMKEVDIRSLVSQCLNSSFYYHSAVSLDSLKKCEEMRSLAIDKYGLPLAEIELHGHAGEEGMDVLEVIGDMHLFVATHSFNLNSQCFVDRTATDSNTFGIQHVVSSISTHGIGVTQSAISSVQDYLAQRFQHFSELLLDDKIRSVFAKEARTFRREQSGIKSFNSASTPARSNDYSVVRISAT
jgi:WASH complex subunit 7|tara:strand:+ start:641 stop:1435 length:795 start_codon:yes stop_codon:yes gene_type:complete